MSDPTADPPTVPRPTLTDLRERGTLEVTEIAISVQREYDSDQWTLTWHAYLAPTEDHQTAAQVLMDAAQEALRNHQEYLTRLDELEGWITAYRRHPDELRNRAPEIAADASLTLADRQRLAAIIAEKIPQRERDRARETPREPRRTKVEPPETTPDVDEDFEPDEIPF